MAKRPQKRRKLSVASSVTSTTTTTTTATESTGTGTGAMSRSSSLRLAGDAFVFPLPDIFRDRSCVSCHRALGANPALGSKQSHFVVCPRCRATSCTICSRTCTSIPASQPPTPLLSFSPSPPGTPLAPAEDRAFNIPTEFHLDETPRTTRAMTTSRMNERTESARRRRYSDIVDDDERTVVGAEEDDSLLARLKGVDDSGATPGCGRVMCKNCCIENVQTGTTTCYDCYGLPPPVHATNTDDCRRSACDSEYSSTNPSMTSLLL